MIVVYRVTSDLPARVRDAFERQGVRLRLGDAVVVRGGMRPVVMRELDEDITPLLSALEVESTEPEPGETPPRPRPGSSYLRLVPKRSERSAG